MILPPSSAGSALVVADAKDEPAAGFYLQYGFKRFVTDPMRLYIAMAVVARLFLTPELDAWRH